MPPEPPLLPELALATFVVPYCPPAPGVLVTAPLPVIIFADGAPTQLYCPSWPFKPPPAPPMKLSTGFVPIDIEPPPPPAKAIVVAGLAYWR